MPDAAAAAAAAAAPELSPTAIAELAASTAAASWAAASAAAAAAADCICIGISDRLAIEPQAVVLSRMAAAVVDPCRAAVTSA